MPVCCSNLRAISSAMFWGVEVYQETVPSALAAVRSAAGAAGAGADVGGGAEAAVHPAASTTSPAAQARRSMWRMASVSQVHRLRLAEEGFDNMLDDAVVLLRHAAVGDAGQDRELLVRIGQPLEELDQVVETGDPVVLAAQNDGGYGDLLWIDDRQVPAHVDVRAVGH